MVMLLHLAIGSASAGDTLRLDPGVGWWGGDSTSMPALGVSASWKHGQHVFEAGHDRLEALFSSDSSRRTTLLYGRREEWTRGPVYAALDGALGVGFGPDTTPVAPSATAFGAVAQARLSLGTRSFGLQGRALGMLGTAPLDGALTVGLYAAIPLD